MSLDSLMLFKPDSERFTAELRGNIYMLHEIGKSLLILSGLQVTQHVRKQLMPVQVEAIYAKALAPNPEEDALYGTAWKNGVVMHLSSAPVDAYFVRDEGGNAEVKAKSVKNFLRETLVTAPNVIENIAHVPDEDEYDVVRSILLNEE